MPSMLNFEEHPIFATFVATVLGQLIDADPTSTYSNTGEYLVYAVNVHLRGGMIEMLDRYYDNLGL